MSLDPASIHGGRYQRIGEIIERDLELILVRWQQRCGELRLTTTDNHWLALSRVREFLQALATQLCSSRRSAHEPQQTAADLGELRWKLGWDLRQVVREYLVLRLILLDHLNRECDTSLTAEELLAISLNIDEAIIAAATEFAEHEERIRDEYESELERSNRELKRFSHVIAHELKSPLNTQLLGLATIERQLGAAVEQPELRQALTTTQNAVQAMSRLIGELLRYAEVGSDESEVRPTNCRAIVDAAIRNLQTEISRNGAHITCGELPTVPANPSTLTLVFQNLIGNAIHYRRDQTPEICIEASQGEGECRFAVSDNGLGIDEEDLPRIFEMFSRAHVEQRPTGTGIGLAMCRRIVKQHGGRIWAESEAGSGSRFCFTIPLPQKQPSTEANEAESAGIA